MLFHLIGNGPAQHPAFANGIGSLIDQKFRIVFQRSIVNGIWIEGPVSYTHLFPSLLMVETASGFPKISMTSSCDIPNFSGKMSRGFCNI